MNKPLIGDSTYEDTYSELVEDVQALQKLSKEILQAGKALNRNGGSPELRDKVTNDIEEAQRLQPRIAERLPDLTRFADTVSGTPRTKRNAQHRKLQRDFNKCEKEFARVSTAAKKALQRKPAYSPANDLESGSMSLNNTENRQQDGLQAIVVTNEALIEERNQGALAIQEGAQQVADVYKDLAHIVNEQQQDIDNIEDQIEQSTAATKAGVDQVIQAEGKQKSSKCCVKVLLGIVVIAVIVIAVLIMGNR